MHQLFVPPSLEIGVDHDDVLMDFMRAFIAYYDRTQRKPNEPARPYEDIYSFNLAEVFGITRQEIVKIILGLYQSPEFAAIQPIAGASEALEHITADGHRLHVITSRPLEVAAATRTETETHYYGLIRSHHLLDHVRSKEEKEQTQQQDICKGGKGQEVGIHLLIDDGHHNLEKAADYGIAGILMRRPWNLDKTPPKGCIEAHNWNEVPHLIWRYAMNGRF